MSKIRILFFGVTAEIVGSRKLDFEVGQEMTAKLLSKQLVTEYPNLANHRLIHSINQQYSTGNEIICDGDEVAVFTAVSGG